MVFDEEGQFTKADADFLLERWRAPGALRRGCKFICSVPAELGAVTKLKKSNGKVVAETESGIPMIVPHTNAEDC